MVCMFVAVRVAQVVFDQKHNNDWLALSNVGMSRPSATMGGFPMGVSAPPAPHQYVNNYCDFDKRYPFEPSVKNTTVFDARQRNVGMSAGMCWERQPDAKNSEEN